MLPYLSDRPPSFAFMVHYRGDADLDRLDCSRFIRDHSGSMEEFRNKMCSLRPLVAGEITFGFDAVRGEVLLIPRMPRDFLGSSAATLVIEGLKVAYARGVRVLGLGALTAPATHGGTMLLSYVPTGILLTNGNALTAAVVAADVEDALAARGCGSMVAVIGCTGSIGVTTTRLLSAEGCTLLLVGRHPDNVRERLADIARHHAIASSLADVADADIIVCLTSSVTARLSPELLRPGSLILDYAQPVNVDRSRYAAFASAGVAVAQGGLVQIPRYHCSVDLGLPEGATFACLAETYLYVREGYREHSVGTPTVEQARQFWRVARRRGVRRLPLGPSAAPMLANPETVTSSPANCRNWPR